MATVPYSQFIHDAEIFSLSAQRIMGGLACLTLDGVLTMLLFLLPVGMPIALIGVALLATAGQGEHRG